MIGFRTFQAIGFSLFNLQGSAGLGFGVSQGHESIKDGIFVKTITDNGVAAKVSDMPFLPTRTPLLPNSCYLTGRYIEGR